jgi:hypothetical protein
MFCCLLLFFFGFGFVLFVVLLLILLFAPKCNLSLKNCPSEYNIKLHILDFGTIPSVKDLYSRTI